MADLRQTAERVKRETERARARSTVDVMLPIYEGSYVARFGVLPAERIEEVNTAIDRDNTDVAAEFIAEACRTICVMGDSKPEPLTDDGHAVRFDQAFADAVGLTLEDESGAAVVRAVWTLDDGTLNELAIGNLGVRLVAWMSDTTKTMAGELAGKSPNGPPSATLEAPLPPG